MLRTRQSADMEVTDEISHSAPSPAVFLTWAVALTLWPWSFSAQAGSQTSAPTVLSLRSVPDGLDVYVGRAGQPDTHLQPETTSRGEHL